MGRTSYLVSGVTIGAMSGATRVVLGSVLFVAACASAMLPEPWVHFKEAPFAEKPRIVRRENAFYLRYRMTLQQAGVTPRYVLVAKKTADKAYYYLGRPVSHPEYGNLVERPLAFDGLTEFAQRNAVYWLNPDGSEIRLEIHSERP